MTITYDFKGQVALITGAGSGIGLATAKALAASGAAVALADVNETALNDATDELKAAQRAHHHEIALARSGGAATPEIGREHLQQ